MEKAILGKKIGMTQLFSETGKFIPVTVVEAGPCVVTQKKTVETDGYNSIQVGFLEAREKKTKAIDFMRGFEIKKKLKKVKPQGRQRKVKRWLLTKLSLKLLLKILK